MSFNVPYRNHFRVTTLPDSSTLRDVFGRVDELLTAYATAPRGEGLSPGTSGQSNVVSAGNRFK